MMQKEYDSKYMTGSTTKLIAPAVEYIKKNYTREDIGLPQAALLFAKHSRQLWLKLQDLEKMFCFGILFAVPELLV